MSRIVVTTAVQFFESLFANRTSRCRNLHNLADSLIALGEASCVGRRQGDKTPRPHRNSCDADGDGARQFQHLVQSAASADHFQYIEGWLGIDHLGLAGLLQREPDLLAIGRRRDVGAERAVSR